MAKKGNSGTPMKGGKGGMSKEMPMKKKGC